MFSTDQQERRPRVERRPRYELRLSPRKDMGAQRRLKASSVLHCVLARQAAQLGSAVLISAVHHASVVVCLPGMRRMTRPGPSVVGGATGPVLGLNCTLSWPGASRGWCEALNTLPESGFRSLGSRAMTGQKRERLQQSHSDDVTRARNKP